MKKHSIFIKAIAGVMLAAVFAVTLVSAGPVRASSFVIDDSVFGSYDVDSMTVWYWRPGIPPTKKDGTRYPILITWDNGKYFFATGQNFFNKEKTYIDLRNNHSDLPMFSYEHADLDIRYINGWYPKKWVGSGGWVGDDINYGKMYPYGYYRYVCSYPTSASEGLTAKLPFDFDTLVEQGCMISLTQLPVPYLVGQGTTVGTDLYADREYNHFIMGVEVPKQLQSDNRYYNTNYKYALLMIHLAWDEYNNKNGNDSLVAGKIKDYFNWHFKPIFTNTLIDLGDLTADSSTLTESQINDFYNKIYDPSGDDLTLTLPNNLVWTFERIYMGQYQYPESVYLIDTDGDWGWHQYNDPTWDDIDPYLNFMSYVSRHAKARMRWNGSIFRTQGNKDDTPFSDDDQDIRFKIYYATPVIMDVLNTSFSVEKGQVCNLDGPILINDNCVITVKEGGTLTISAKSEANGVDLGWVMNNGKIKIEKGGTLYIQKGACLNKYNNKNNAGGGIICEGLVIVDEDAKLCGGGVDGIQFKNGSHVINYGAIISENFTIEKDHTIENRGSKAIVFHGKGNGVTGSGYGLFTGEVTSSGFPERGTVLDTVTDNVNSVANGIYTW